jgi:hypothetical protein
MMADILIVIWPIKPICQDQTLLTKMQNLYFNDIKLCTLAFVSIINAKKIVHVMKQLMMNVYLVSAVINAFNLKRDCYKQKENCKKKVLTIWMIWNLVLVKKQNATKNIVLVMQREENVQIYVNVMNVQIVTFMIMNHHKSQDIQLTLIWIMIEE